MSSRWLVVWTVGGALGLTAIVTAGWVGWLWLCVGLAYGIFFVTAMGGSKQ